MNEKLTFEAAMQKLGDVVAKLEDGNESLEDSLKLFEEGTSLVNLCYKKLQNAEQKLKIIAEQEQLNEKGRS